MDDTNAVNVANADDETSHSETPSDDKASSDSAVLDGDEADDSDEGSKKKKKKEPGKLPPRPSEPSSKDSREAAMQALRNWNRRR